MHEERKISIIIPVHNEQNNLSKLTGRISNLLTAKNIEYQIVFVDDHSTDKSAEMIHHFSQNYPVVLVQNKYKKGKANSILEGVSHARYENICLIDADLQYPPEAIPDMLDKIISGSADIVIGNRKIWHDSVFRKLFSRLNNLFFEKILHKFDCDVQSGLKVFRKEIIERMVFHQSPWNFDLEFLILARNAGYRIAGHEIVFSKRLYGDAKSKSPAAVIKAAFSAIIHKISHQDIIPFHPKMISEKGYGFHHKGREFVHHSPLHIDRSAFHRFSDMQIAFLLIMTELFILGIVFNWHLTFVVITALLTGLYFADLLFNLFLVYRSHTREPEIKIIGSDLAALDDNNLPRYTVLCPLYKEWKILPQFVTAIDNLDYPKDKLQIMLLLEEDDLETIEIVKSLDLPDYFGYIIVPHSKPKTKPKASNYGLRYATGEYVVIYDAEDIPDPLQLKKAVIAFQKAGPRTVCIQAKLNFYNPNQNLLTRIFTAEYSLWFDLVLTGLQSIHAPIPLGGTSNHFKIKDLQMLKGWDSFNVTEDADLGMRLVKAGYRTAVIDSVTLEEANSNIFNWFSQRTRWIKGYIQTYFLHMRDPQEFLKSWKEPHFATFQLIIGGKVLSMLINPLMWIITISYFVFRGTVGGFIESFYPAPVLYMAIFSLLFGNFLYLYYYMLGCIKHGHDGLVKYVLIVPFYWLAMSLAAYVAFYKFLVSPHYWAKTKHGLHINKDKSVTHISHTALQRLSPIIKKIKNRFADNKDNKLSVSICIPAYNEGKNIANILSALASQKTERIMINKIIVVSSGSTDKTDDIVTWYTQQYHNIHLLKQAKRAGKASAINEFLKIVSDEVVVIESADTVPEPDTIEKLCVPFLENEKIGMTGGAPIPVNDPRTFLGYIIHAWWWFHRNIPRFGEIIAYRNILPEISPTTAVDEAFIQAKMVKLGYSIIHVNDAVVKNKGAETVTDLIKQRRRVMNGHARLHKHEGIKIDNMTKSSLKLLLFKYKLNNLKEFFWLTGGICIEIYARLLGAYDYRISRKNPFVWDIASTTKEFTVNETVNKEAVNL